jgi:SAM-dependent methyltransferase
LNPLKQNREAWDQRAEQRLAHTETAGDAQFANPWTYLDDCGWLGRNVSGQRVLCLAAGGGWHGPLFASVGARVTVVDLSPAMLERDKAVAAERNLALHLLQASMDDLTPLGEASFDLIIQPVSTCYVPDINRVYREVARVAAPGALYISQHKQPANLQAGSVPSSFAIRNSSLPISAYPVTEPYYRSGPLPPAEPGVLHRETGTLEYLHRWDDLAGGLCRAGFVIEDVAEPRHGDPHAPPGTFRHRSWYIPPYITFKARRTTQPAAKTTLWVPHPQ